MRYFKVSLFALALLLGLNTGCRPQSGQTPIGRGKLKVVATTGMIADAAQIIGGEHVDVSALMGPGTDPHTYLPSPSDADLLASAHIVFFNGLHLEGKMTELLDNKSTSKSRAVAVTSRLDPKNDLRTVDGGDGAHDPHVWFDVKLWIRCVEVIRDELVSLDPDHKQDYFANATRYLADLDTLEREVKAKAASIPAKRRIMVTSHDAFGYFAKAYGFEVRGLQGVSTAAAAGTKDVDDLAEYIGTHEVPAIFAETSVRDKGLKKVLDTVKSKYGRDVQLIGGDDALYSDALGEPGTSGATYIGMVRHNIDVLVKALKP